jgi:hypothetical protein
VLEVTETVGVRVRVLVGVRVGVLDGVRVREGVIVRILVSEGLGVALEVLVETKTGGVVSTGSGVEDPRRPWPRRAIPRIVIPIIPPITGIIQLLKEAAPPFDLGGVRGGAPPAN